MLYDTIEFVEMLNKLFYGKNVALFEILISSYNATRLELCVTCFDKEKRIETTEKLKNVLKIFNIEYESYSAFRLNVDLISLYNSNYKKTELYRSLQTKIKFNL